VNIHIVDPDIPDVNTVDFVELEEESRECEYIMNPGDKGHVGTDMKDGDEGYDIDFDEIGGAIYQMIMMTDVMVMIMMVITMMTLFVKAPKAVKTRKVRGMQMSTLPEEKERSMKAGRPAVKVGGKRMKLRRGITVDSGVSANVMPKRMLRKQKMSTSQRTMAASPMRVSATLSSRPSRATGRTSPPRSQR
jgi:hypothetical protein